MVAAGVGHARRLGGSRAGRGRREGDVPHACCPHERLLGVACFIYDGRLRVEALGRDDYVVGGPPDDNC
eukprot:9023392-Pyramimonas_sp.AAC.1